MVGNFMQITAGTNFTTGFYEIIAVDGNNEATLDRTCGTAGKVNGTACLGGAYNNLDATLLNTATSSPVAGNTVYVKSGAYSQASGTTTTNVGTLASIIKVVGYVTSRSTIPYGSDRPAFTGATNGYWTFPAYWQLENLSFTGSTSNIQTGVVPAAATTTMVNCSIVNPTTTASAFATALGNYYNCQASCLNGYAIKSPQTVIGCYVYDSATGIYFTGYDIDYATVISSIIDTCKTGVNLTTTHTIDTLSRIYGNTFRGNGTALYYSTASVGNCVINNIFADNYIGLSLPSANTNILLACNCWNNSTISGYTDIVSSYCSKGTTDITSDPKLNGTIVTGADGNVSATSPSNLELRAASNPFSGVATTDTVNIVAIGSGTGTTGVYAISAVNSNNSITLATAPGSNALTSITYIIVKGKDYTLATNSPCFNNGLEPNSVNAGLTGTYNMNIGACQTDAVTNGTTTTTNKII